MEHKIERNPEAKKKQIIEAAIELMNRKEYFNCLIDEVARKAGVGKGTVYLYFSSKEELYYAILLELVADLRQVVAEVAGSQCAPAQQVELLFQRLCAFMRAHTHVYTIAREEAKPSQGKLPPRLREAYRELRGDVCRVLEKAIQEGAVKNYPPVLLARLFLHTSGLVARVNTAPGEAVPDAVMYSIIMKGIENQ